MPGSYHQLDLIERRYLSDLHERKVSVSEIARQLGRHRSTIYRELKRNRFVDDGMPDLDGYYARIANQFAAARRERLLKLLRHAELRETVIDRLKDGWSPEQIAGRLAIEPSAPLRLCHETIYRFVYSKPGRDLGLSRFLPERRKRRRVRGLRRHRRDHAFPLENSISMRPDRINDRGEFGHWEVDLIHFRRVFGKRNMTSAVERVTRYAILIPNEDRQSEPVMTAIADALLSLPLDARKSYTFDRGTEFAAWRQLCSDAGGEAWFCDPSAPWQKGAVENSNRRIRRYLPSNLNPSNLSASDLNDVLTKLNATPRKCLGFRTPSEALRDQLHKITYPPPSKSAFEQEPD